jgi:hypothetical protein
MNYSRIGLQRRSAHESGDIELSERIKSGQS